MVQQKVPRLKRGHTEAGVFNRMQKVLFHTIPLPRQGLQFPCPRQCPNGEKEASSVEETLRTIVKIIVEAADPDKIILFGSRSRKGWSHDSDYDILVIKEGVEHRRKLTQEIYRALSEVPVAIDIVLETPERLARYSDTQGLVYAEALKGRVLYER